MVTGGPFVFPTSSPANLEANESSQTSGNVSSFPFPFALDLGDIFLGFLCKLKFCMFREDIGCLRIKLR